MDTKPGTVAIQQALFFHFRLTIRQISALVQRRYNTVHSNVTGYIGQMPWWRRQNKELAIEAAKQLLDRNTDIGTLKPGV